jgi:glycosyltransferase involved in cell wall biosynthesis
VKILFVYDNLYAVGGVQTWLTRILPALRREGHEVALLTRPPGEPWDATSEYIDRVAESATIHPAGRHWFRDPKPLRSRPPSADVVFACNLPSLLKGALVQQHFIPDAKLVAGVFHPREYSWQTPRLRRRWVQHVGERILRGLPAENFVFTADVQMHVVADFLGRSLGASPVVPIAIDTDRFRPSPGREADRRKIVSVARLSPYYTYIRQMIRVVHQLREQGHEFTYASYGDGEERAELEAEATRLGVDDAVSFHGAVPYSRFEEVVDDAFAFIGIGTSLLEAAACGVPALVAIDSHPGAATHGFIHETEGNAIGGYVEGHPEQPIAERLLWLAERSPSEYREIERASRARAEEFGLSRLLPRFVEALRQAAHHSAPISHADRFVGQLDWLLEAVMLNLGGRDTLTQRFVRPLPSEEPATR